MTTCDAEATDMRTTVTLDDDLVSEAMELTGIEERTALLRHALKSLIAIEAGKRLARLGGTMPDAWAPPRRRVFGPDDDPLEAETA